ESDCSTVCRDRTEFGDRRRERFAQIVPHCRISWDGVRSVPDYGSGRRRGGGSTARGTGRGPFLQPPQTVRATAGEGTRLSVRGRFPARIADTLHRRSRPAAHVAVCQGVRLIARTEEEL